VVGQPLALVNGLDGEARTADRLELDRQSSPSAGRV
jgi:hypothetical protein